jgi:hypothetical protein
MYTCRYQVFSLERSLAFKHAATRTLVVKRAVSSSLTVKLVREVQRETARLSTSI